MTVDQTDIKRFCSLLGTTVSAYLACDAKFATKLRELKTYDNPLLKTNFHAGHSSSSGRYDFLNNGSFEDSFLSDWLLGDNPTLEPPSLGNA